MSKNKVTINILCLFMIAISFNLSICIDKKLSISLPYKILDRSKNYQSKESIYISLDKTYFYTLFEMGSPAKKIPIFYTFDNSSLSLNSDLDLNLESSYNPSNSKSFKHLDNNKVQDDLLLDIDNEVSLKNFAFLYSGESNKNFYGFIGLQNFFREFISKSNEKPIFLNQLKELGIINYLSFSINQTSNDTGFINFNLEPHEYAPELYSDQHKHIMFVNGVESKDINSALGEYLWNLEISLVYYKNHENKLITVNTDHYELGDQQYATILNPASGLIKGPLSFYNLINKDFFKDFIKNKICASSTVNKLSFYYCDAKYKNKLKEKFPNLYLYHQEQDYKFVLEFDDLFEEINGTLYFLVCYDKGIFGDDAFTKISEWVLGRPFFKKYQLSFDVEKKQVLFYENLSGYPHIQKEKAIKEKEKEKKLKETNKEGEDDSYVDKLLPKKNLALIALAIFIIFVAMFCISYHLRADHKKFEEEKDNEQEKAVELKENLN